MTVQKKRCPYCGLLIFLNDDERKASHRAPECLQFAALVRRSKVITFVETLDKEGNPVGRGKA